MASLTVSNVLMPEQNGITERKYRQRVEIGLSLLAYSSVPLSFWDVAFDTAIFLINWMPTCVLNHSSPYEILFQNNPRLHYFTCI